MKTPKTPAAPLTLPKGVKIEAVRLHVHQPQDSCGSPDEDTQDLAIETADAGDGPYLVLTTERWALDPEDIDAFAALLRDVLRMREGERGGEA